MTTYVVLRKSDGVEVFRYCAESTIEWEGMPFDEYDHNAIPDDPDPDPPEPPVIVMTRLEYLQRFTSAERMAIRAASKSNAQLEDYLALLDATENVHNNHPDVIAALTTLESVGLLASGRKEEILYG